MPMPDTTRSRALQTGITYAVSGCNDEAITLTFIATLEAFMEALPITIAPGSAIPLPHGMMGALKPTNR